MVDYTCQRQNGASRAGTVDIIKRFSEGGASSGRHCGDREPADPACHVQLGTDRGGAWFLAGDLKGAFFRRSARDALRELCRELIVAQKVRGPRFGERIYAHLP
jgi:hypothetical protein